MQNATAFVLGFLHNVLPHTTVGLPLLTTSMILRPSMYRHSGPLRTGTHRALTASQDLIPRGGFSCAHVALSLHLGQCRRPSCCLTASRHSLHTECMQQRRWGSHSSFLHCTHKVSGATRNTSSSSFFAVFCFVSEIASFSLLVSQLGQLP